MSDSLAIKSVLFPEAQNMSSLCRGTLPWGEGRDGRRWKGDTGLCQVILDGLPRARRGRGGESKRQGSRCQGVQVPSGKGGTGMLEQVCVPDTQ